ncbi:YtxH domain-containing protein [Virgibacillus sp. L01]|uniref:YtxH domain-containing protein n=1 Tax=Virgibacillus sp. L01 TaxID=3457429 RepID=UPI003FD0AC82
MANGKSLFLGIMVGGTVSAAATLLSTPSSGRDLRYRAKEQGLEWKSMLENIKLDGLRLKKQISETSKEGAALIKELTQEMKSSVQEWKGTVEPHQENIHEYLEQIESSLKDLETKLKKE